MTKNEFERLQPGQLIQHKKDNKWAFIVHQNFGDRLTAVRTIEVRDPENWEIVTKVEVEFTINQVAHELHEILKNQSWYQTTGIGDKELIVYTKRKKHPNLINVLRGFNINYKYMGNPKP